MRASLAVSGSSVVLCVLLAACALKVVDLDPLEESGMSSVTPFGDVAVVEELYGVPDRWDDAGSYQRGLRQAMRTAQLFRRVSRPESLDFTPDLIVRGQVEGRFEYSGGLNFVTWFPGPFILMHNWRGNRYEYVTQAEIELIDARTETPVQHYQVQSRHRLIHRSGSPFPIFGAALIFPGIIRGSTNIGPRPLYRQEMYEQAYADLWHKVIEAIRAERTPYYAARHQERVDRCGDELNIRPVVGTLWSDFISCQTSGFYAREERDTPEGVKTIYTDGDAMLEIHVIDGRIVRWIVLERPTRRGPAPS